MTARLRVLAGLAAISLAAGAVVYRVAAGRIRIAHPNILLVTIDTLRADHVGSYGYAAARTPALDALARRGWRFERAMTVTPLTLPAHASLLTGTFPGHHGVRDNAGFALAGDAATLAEALHAAGYRTGAFVAAFVLDHRSGLDQGFDRYSDPFDLGQYSPDISPDAVQRRGAAVVDETIGWINEDRTHPFLAWVHLYEPHAPYDPPARMRARFPSTTIGAYDAEIATADEQVGRLVDMLSGDGRIGRTIVAVLGDHGEALGEHQEREHGFFLYDATVRIPLIVAGPGISSRAIAEQVRIVDVMPTLLDLAGIAIPQAVQGETLRPLLRGGGRDLVALSETWYPRLHFGWSELTAIHDGRYTLVSAPRRELYDTRTDPEQTRDLAAREPARADSLERALHDLAARTSSPKPSVAASPVDRQTAERLRALGYVGATVSRQGGDPKRLADPKDKIGVYNLLKQAGDESLQGRLDDAVRTLRHALAIDPDVVEGHTMLGSFLRKSKRDSEALAAFEAALALDPHSAKSAWQLAEILMVRREYGKAATVLERAIPDAMDRPPFLVKLAECQIELKRLDEAERHLLEALGEKRDLAEAHYDLGLIHEGRGEIRQAIAEYEAELQRYPKMDRAHFNLAKLLAASARGAEAIQHFQAAVDANPAFGSGYLYLAKARLDAGDLAAAEAAARTGLSREPDPRIAPLGHYVLADVYNRMGRREDAAREAAAGKRLEESGDRRSGDRRR